MAWKIKTLTTAAPTDRLSFAGRGSIFPTGTFGGGTVTIKPIAVDEATNAENVAPSAVFTIDGSTEISADVPSGYYEIELAGSTGGDVDVYYNDQSELAITR